MSFGGPGPRVGSLDQLAVWLFGCLFARLLTLSKQAEAGAQKSS